MSKQIVLEATGEMITFVKTAADTNGEFVEAIAFLPAGGEGPPPHRHPLQNEEFEVIDGRVSVECDGKKQELGKGQTFLVPANSLHRFYSSDSNEVKLKASFQPGLNIEYLLTEIFAACNRRQSKDPSPFDGSYILSQVRSEYYLGDVPIFVQNMFFQSLLSWVKR